MAKTDAKAIPYQPGSVGLNDKIQFDKENEKFYKQEIDEKRYTPDEDEQRLVNETYARFTRLKEAKTKVNIENKWKEAEANLLSETPEQDEDDNRSNLFIPITHATVDSILSEWIRQPTTGTVAPSEDPEDAPRAELVDLIRQFIERKNRVAVLDTDLHYDIVGFGNGIQKVYYKLGKRKIHVAKGVSGGKMQYEEKIIDDFDDVCIENVDIKMFFPDDGARQPDFSDMKDCIERKILTYSEFEVEYSDYENTKFVKRGGEVTEEEWKEKPTDIDDTDVEVVWWWHKTRDFVRIVANNVFLCDMPLPYDDKELPFCGSGDIKRPGHFWWIGEPELMRHLQAELNTKRNIRSDAEKVSTLPPVFAPTTGRLEDDEIILEPGKIHYFAGAVPPTQLQINTDFSASYISEDRLKDDIVSTTGVDRRMEGLANSNETATEVATRKESTMKRIAKKIITNQLRLEERRGQLIINRIMQFYAEPKISLVAGRDAVEEYKEALEKMKKDPDKYIEDEENGDIYEKKPRRIRIDNKEVKVDAKRTPDGKVKDVKLKIREKKGYSFFDTTPELIKGKFDFVVIPDFNLPVTKAQEIEMTNMLYDRLISNPVITSPDGKLHGQNGESMPMPKGLLKLTEDLLKKNGRNSEEYLPDEDAAQGGDDMMAQAQKENMAMMQGIDLAGGTPLASPEHTMVHNQFLEQNVTEDQVEIREMFLAHIRAEQMFQEEIVNKMRGGQNGNQTSGGGEPQQRGAGNPQQLLQQSGV